MLIVPFEVLIASKLCCMYVIDMLCGYTHMYLDEFLYGGT